MGRPRLAAADTSISAHVCVTSRQYDRLCAEARSAGISIAEVIRRALARDPRVS